VSLPSFNRVGNAPRVGKHVEKGFERDAKSNSTPSRGVAHAVKRCDSTLNTYQFENLSDW
jgi:hypothetical protein